MDKFVFDSGHDYEYAFYINDQLIIATNDGFRQDLCANWFADLMDE